MVDKPQPVYGYNSDHTPVSEESFQILREEFDYEPCDTVACPAQAAGYAPGEGDASLSIADAYDSVIADMYQSGEIERIDGDFIVTAEDAETAWLQAIRRVEDGAYGVFHQHTREQAVEAGKAIARELGWLDDSGGVSFD